MPSQTQVRSATSVVLSAANKLQPSIEAPPTSTQKPANKVKLSDVLPPFILGCSAFSPQINSQPHQMPIETIIHRALSLGFRGFDTSPYYGDSEVFLGQALHNLQEKGLYSREESILMTKAGRISANKFDYSPEGVIQSVHRSMERFHSTYLDVVFCHDVEFVSEEEVLGAVKTLFDLADGGHIRYVGISGYPLPILLSLCRMIKARLGRQVDAVQSYGHFTLQNTTLQDYAARFRETEVDVLFSASPIAMGLLRKEGVPLGDLGDFHPAPPELRRRCQEAALWVEKQGHDLAAVATRFVAGGWQAGNRRTGGGAAVILGGCSCVAELERNVSSIKEVAELERVAGKRMQASLAVTEVDGMLFQGVQDILGDFVDFAWASPEQGWKREN